MTRFLTIIISSVLILAAGGATAQEGTHQLLGKFGDWSAFMNSAEGKRCFASTQPRDSKYSQNISGRDPAFFMVTTMPAQKVVNQTSTKIGYPFKGGTSVKVGVAEAQFVMFTSDDWAWLDPQGDENGLIAAMKAGRTMTVQGTSRRGTITTDTYSLSGVTAAIDAMNRACSG